MGRKKAHEAVELDQTAVGDEGEDGGERYEKLVDGLVSSG